MKAIDRYERGKKMINRRLVSMMVIGILLFAIEKVAISADVLLYDLSGRIVSSYSYGERKVFMVPPRVGDPPARDGNFLDLDGINDMAVARLFGPLDRFDIPGKNLAIEASLYLRSLRPGKDERASITYLAEASPYTGLVIINNPGQVDLKIPAFTSPGAIFQPPDGEPLVAVHSGLKVPLKKWFHTSVGYDVENQTIFISLNDIMVILDRTPMKRGQIKHPFTVGFTQVPNEPDERLNGAIDELKVSEIVKVGFNFPFLKIDKTTQALWNFNEPIGTTIFKDLVKGNLLTGINGAKANGMPLADKNDARPKSSMAVEPNNKLISIWGMIKRY